MQEQRGRAYHCSDCDLTIHENDKENHLNGGRHKYKVRLKQNQDHEESPTPAPYECTVCQTKFTDSHFYTIHQGSKTHKRNLRKLRPIKTKKKKDADNLTFKPRKRTLGRSDTSPTIDECGNICDYRSEREKYRPRNTKNPEGNNKIYVSSVTAYWAVTLALNPHMRQFKISINDKEWGDFGDVVVQIDLRATKGEPGLVTTFAIQFKDVSNNVNCIDSLTEGRFAFAKYLAQVTSLNPPEGTEKKKFVIFTTSLPDAMLVKHLKLKKELLHKSAQECDCSEAEKDISVVAKTLSNRRKLLINTSDDNDNIFFFFSTDRVHTMPTIYLYTRQKKQKHYATWLDDSIYESLPIERRIQIGRDFIKYIEYWGDGLLGGNYRLKKEDVLVKLGHLLLYSFKIPPSVLKTTERPSYAIWQRAVNSVDVTILKKHPVIVSKICEPINIRIEEVLELKIDTTTASIDLNQDIIKNIQNPVLKMYLFEETLGDIEDDVPLDIAYDFFWKAGLVPLPLQVEHLKDREYVLSVIALLKSLGLRRRYFVMTPEQDIKNSLRYYKTVAFFVTVDDIADKIPSELLDQVEINVTDTLSLSLKKIQESDMFFLKTVTAHEFFDMSLGKYGFKSCSNNLAARKGGQKAQLVLGDKTMTVLRDEIESKDEMKLVFVKQETYVEIRQHYLRGVRPNMFSL